MTERQSAWFGYAAAIGGSALALLLRVLLLPYFEHRTILVIYMPAVVFAALAGGFWPAMLATVLCTAISIAFIGGGVIESPANYIDVGFFLALGPVLGLVGQRQLRQSDDAQYRQAQLQSILDTVPEAMIVIDEKGIMRSFSAAAVRLFGWTADEMLGRNVSALMPSPYRGEHDGYLHRYLTTGEKRIIGIGRIVVGERKDGSTFPMELAVGEAK